MSLAACSPPAAAAAPSSAALAAARDALAVHGPVSRQEPIEWGSEEPLAPALAAFYRQVGPGWVEVDTLGLPFLFFPLDVVVESWSTCDAPPAALSISFISLAWSG